MEQRGGTTCAEESIRLPAEAASAGAARRFVRDTLRRCEQGDLEDAAALCVSELVANVAVHTDSPECVVTVRAADDDVVIEVADGDGEMPCLEPAPPYSEHGRGLHIISALAGEWGVRRGTGPCKAVWARLCPPDQPRHD